MDTEGVAIDSMTVETSRNFYDGEDTSKPRDDEFRTFNAESVKESQSYTSKLRMYEKAIPKWKSDLGAKQTYERKMTLRDLGQHMSKRMMASMEKLDGSIKSNPNLFYGLELARPSKSGDDLEPSSFYKQKLDETTYDLSTSSGAYMANKAYRITGDDGIKATDPRFIIYRNLYGPLKDQISYDEAAKLAEKSCGLQLGEAKVLNPDFQFNELDDIPSDFRRPKLGRLYSERIYDYNLPIIFFQPGTINIDLSAINTLAQLSGAMYYSRTNKEGANAYNYLKGDKSSFFKGIVRGIGNIGTGLVRLIGHGAKTALDVIQFYSWVPEYGKYIKQVNEIMLDLAFYMGVIDVESDSKVSKWINDKANSIRGFVDRLKGKDVNLMEDSTDTTEVLNNLVSPETAANAIPDSNLIKNGGFLTSGSYGGYIGAHKYLSALKILPQFNGRELNEEDIFTDNDNDEGSFFNKMFGDEAVGIADTVVPFGLSKNITISETFSNSTSPHPLSEQYNQAFDEANSTKMRGFSGNITEMVEQIRGGNFSWNDAAGNLWNSGMQWIGNKVLETMQGDVGMMINGQARFVLPETWNDSTFDRSYSISFKFRSPYGNKLAIFENEFIPLVFLIAMSASRKTNVQSYLNPFYVKVFAKGFFSCELGMITSLSISRGQDSNDRTVEGFFRTLDVSLSLKDMLPNLSMALEGGAFLATKGANSGFNNFLCNLAGIDFIQRSTMKFQIDRLATALTANYENFGAHAKFWVRGTPPAKVVSMAKTMFKGDTINPFNTLLPKKF